MTTLIARQICALVILAGFVSAARAQHRFDSWTTDNGLPHNAIRAIHQSRDGYLWLTTENGLARFDGVRFHVFRKDTTPGLTSNSFAYHALHEDRRGALWMGTYDAGVIRYHDQRFDSWSVADGLPHNRIFRIDEDAEGVIWIFTEGGLAKWQDGRLIRVAPAPDSPFNDYYANSRELLGGVDGQYLGLWRKDGAGWQRFAHGRWTPVPLPPHITDPARLRVDSIQEDFRGNVWYDILGREDERYLVKDGRLSVVRNEHPDDDSYVCYQDSQGRVWAGSHSSLNGFWKDGQFTPLPELVTSNIFKVLEDREGGLWIATFFEGLHRLREQFITFRRPARGSGQKFSRTAGAMIEDRRGRVWARGAAFAEVKDGGFAYHYRRGRSRQGWDWGNVVNALYEDQDGSIWAATWDGIVRFRDGRLHEEDDLSNQIKGRVRVIRRDRRGDLWFGMESGGGLYRLRRDGTLTHYTTSDGLAGASVGTILEDRAGNLWVGTDRGLSCFDGASNFATPVAAEELPTAVSSLYEDAAGVLWVGTGEHGLYRLAPGPGGVKVTRYTTAQGLYNNQINLILEDDLGFVWTVCHLGLIRVRKQELEDYAAGRTTSVTSTRFGKTHGLINERTGAFAEPVGYGFKARDGRLWFATREGLAVVDPRKVPFNAAPPPVRIEECLLDRRPTGFAGELRVNPGDENLEISYTAPSLSRSEQIRFKYKLEGLDEGWVAAGTRRTAYYSHLPAGAYTFRVAAANSDGVWNAEGQSLRVVVLPPFWRTWWFVALGASCALGLAFFAYRLRVGHLKRRHAAQEEFSRRLINAHESERRRIAAELHDGLGQSLAIIKNSAVFGALSAADLAAAKAQLTDISAQSARAIGEVREIAHNLRPYLLDRLGLTKALRSMLNKVADTGAIELTADVDEMDGLFTAEAEMSIYRIIQESLNNILKHADATAAAVAVKKSGRAVTITIRDNGKGFDAGAPVDGDRRGFGLFGMGERVRMLGGTQTIQSAPGEGVTLTIKVESKAKGNDPARDYVAGHVQHLDRQAE